MTKHVDTTTAALNAKRVVAAVPTGHLAKLIADFKAAEQSNAAIDKIEKAMDAICAYHPQADDREAWGDFLRQQLDAGFWINDDDRVKAMVTALVRNVASAPATVGFDSYANDDPEVQMSWLIRSFRDAAMLIDPTIRGFWVGNTLDEDHGATSYYSITFNRGNSRDIPKLRQNYLASGRLEQMDLSDVNLMDLIQLHHAVERYRTAVDDFLACRAFYTHDANGRANGSTWNGEMVEAMREWSEPEHERIIEAIRAYQPEDAQMAYHRALFLVWWEAETSGELKELATIAAEGVATVAALGKAA